MTVRAKRDSRAAEASVDGETGQRLDALLDAAFAGAVARGESTRSGYLDGALAAVALVRETTADAVLRDVQCRAHVADAPITARAVASAVASDELLLHYQPKVSLRKDRLIGMEALVRWQHPRLGLVPPDRFIPVAESGPVITELGTWVLGRACIEVVRWRRVLPNLFVAVNVAARQFTTDLVGTVREALDATGCPPEALVLEVTETTAMTDPARTRKTLEELAALGVRAAIDDFGTGYSSLAYLRRFPLQTIKIDRAFVDGLGVEQEATAIVDAVIGMAHALERTALAEGVETALQVERLRVLGCDNAQGFYFDRPLEGEHALDVVRAVARGEWRPACWEPGHRWEPAGAAPAVLVVDDSDEVRPISAAALASEGFRVFEASRGVDALLSASRLAPACVVLDVDMPGMSGLDVLRHLRHDSGPRIAVVILTGTTRFQAEAEAYALGADDYITKPVRPRDLASRVRAAIERKAPATL